MNFNLLLIAICFILGFILFKKAPTSKTDEFLANEQDKVKNKIDSKKQEIDNIKNEKRDPKDVEDYYNE